MNATNLNIVLTNSLCCISAQAAKVSKLYSIGSKCVESELQKLKLMNDWFEALRCYNTETSISAKFMVRLDYEVYNHILKATSNVGRRYVITVNGVEYSAVGDGVTSVGDLVGLIITSAPGINSLTVVEEPDGYPDRQAYLYIEADCDITSINYQVVRTVDQVVLTDIDFALYQAGLCTVTNCLTEDQYDTIVHKLMSACDICDCQLTQ